MSAPRIILFSLLGFSLGCASTSEVSDTEYLDAIWIVGTWHIRGEIRSGTNTRDVDLFLTFLPNGWVVEGDQPGRSRTARVRWYPRRNRVETAWGGVTLRIQEREEGPPRAELGGSVQARYTVQECANWGFDANGARICLQMATVERYRTVGARGEAILEPGGGTPSNGR